MLANLFKSMPDALLTSMFSAGKHDLNVNKMQCVLRKK